MLWVGRSFVRSPCLALSDAEDLSDVSPNCARLCSAAGLPGPSAESGAAPLWIEITGCVVLPGRAGARCMWAIRSLLQNVEILRHPTNTTAKPTMAIDSWLVRAARSTL